jgi:hypothetical protein
LPWWDLKWAWIWEDGNMWILKVFWAEMILFPLIMLYFIYNSGTWEERSIIQNSTMIMYVLVLLVAIGGYLYVWNKGQNKGK